MKTLYFDCFMGAAGNMLTAALLELMPDKDSALGELNSIGVPHVRFECEDSVKCGIRGTYVKVSVDGEEEGESHHEHSHHHRTAAEIKDLIGKLQVSESVKKSIADVYDLIADAESTVHGVPVTEIHFHEVGMLDAVADIAAVCFLMDRLEPEAVFASPVHVGSGTVKCAHGILPVPAPATAELLKGIPCCSGEIKGELCTPTGAALLRYFVQGFGKMPAMITEKIGYGMGKKDFSAANCVRACLGEAIELDSAVCELKCNLDDMTGEEIGFAAEMLMEGGALDVYTLPVGMKKFRPGIMLGVICRPEDREKMLELIFRHTSTLGVREAVCERTVLEREFFYRETHFGRIRGKRSSGWGTVKEKLEYDDLAKIAREKGITLRELQDDLD